MFDDEPAYAGDVISSALAGEEVKELRQKAAALESQLKERDEEIKRLRIDRYYDGILYGIWLYAWWKDGTQYVGTCGMTLEDARRNIEELHEEELAGLSGERSEEREK